MKWQQLLYSFPLLGARRISQKLHKFSAKAFSSLSTWANCPSVSFPLSVCVCVCVSVSARLYLSLSLSLFLSRLNPSSTCHSKSKSEANAINDRPDRRPLAAPLQGIDGDKCNAMCGQQFYKYFYCTSRASERARQVEREWESENFGFFSGYLLLFVWYFSCHNILFRLFRL